MKAYKFRIYPSKSQEKLLIHHLWIEKNLWNMLLEANQQRYDSEKKFISKTDMQKMVKDTELFSQVAQTLSHRLYNSLWRMIKLRKKGIDCGFPRFKNIHRIKSLIYPQAGFWLSEKLKVTPFGEINIKKHREVEGNIKTLTIKKEPTGKWFATFTVETLPQQPKLNTGKQVGIDLGLKTLATISDGTIIKNPRHLKKYKEKLARFQRLKDRKKKGSKNRRKANFKVARVYAQVANTRLDFLQKETTKLVNNYSLISLEKLASQEMAEQNFGKSINDAGWGLFANLLSYKAEEAGCKVVFVNPENTTQECSRCHQIVKKDLTVRIHDCPHCNLVMDRDLNASLNILQRATVGTTGSNASGDGTKVSSMKEEAVTLASARSG